ncbi:MAG: carboxypeptidase-like regulatory domain-containing protein, partial [Candidatus Symbiothrix sp.]|nr:carboxypeptidase-like regulatory domain-containing protein [Candidatus Symbiothrix sp.]
MMKKRVEQKLILVILSFLLVSALQAQTRKITGVVSYAEDGTPVIGASVSLKGTSIGMPTDLDGSFSLEVPTTAKTLTVSYIGMKTQEVAIGEKSVITIALEQALNEMDEV